MQESSVDDKLFDAILKIASEEAMRQDIDEMLSCREASEQYKPSPALDKKIRKIISRHKFMKRTSSLIRTHDGTFDVIYPASNNSDWKNKLE